MEDGPTRRFVSRTDHECRDHTAEAYEALRQEVREIVVAHKEWCARWTAHYADAGPQLFIAV